MVVILSELRVSAAMDASGFTAGAAAIDDANRRMAASGQAAGAAMAAQDAAIERTGGTLVSLSKAYVPGYTAAARMSQEVAKLQRQLESGGQLAEDPNKLARTTQIYEGMVTKLGQYANATKIAAGGNHEFAAIIDGVNERMSLQVDVSNRAIAAGQKLSVAQQSQVEFNGLLGRPDKTQTAGYAQASASVFQADLGKLEEIARLKAQQVGDEFNRSLNERLRIGYKATDNGAGYGALDEYAKSQIEIARARAEQVGAEFNRSLNEQLRIGVKASDNGAPSVTKTMHGERASSVFQDLEDQAKAVDNLRSKYVPLAKEQKNYLATLSEVRAGVKDGTLSQSEGAAAISRTKEAFASQVVMIRASGVAAGGHSRAMGGMTTQASALGAAIRHSIDAMGAGMSPMRVLMMEFGNLSYGLSGAGALGSVMKDMGSKLLGLITPLRLLTATTALAAIGGTIWYNVIKNQQVAVADLSDRVGASLATLNSLRQLQEVRGTSDFLPNMQKYGDLVVAAQHGVGELASLFRATNTQAKTFNEFLLKTSELIKNAGSDTERIRILESMGLKASYDQLEFWKQGAQTIKESLDSTVQFGSYAERHMIEKARKFDTEWAKSIKQFREGFASGLIEVGGWFDSFLFKARELIASQSQLRTIGRNMINAGKGSRLSGADTDQYYNAVGGAWATAGQGAAGKTKADILKDLQDYNQRISSLGGMASIDQLLAAKENELRIQFINTGIAVGSQKEAIMALYREQLNGVAAVKSQIDATRIQAATIGMSAGAAAEYTAVQTKLNEAIRKGAPLSAADEAALRSNAAGLRDAAQAAALLNIQYDIRRGLQTAFLTSEDVQIAQKLAAIYGNDIPAALASSEAAALRLNNAFRDFSDTSRDTLKGFAQDMKSSLQSGATAWESFGKAGANALNKISDKLMNMAIDNLWSRAFGGGGGGGGFGGILGAIFGTGSSAGSFGGTGGVLGGLYHSGGTIGMAATQSRYVHPAYFDDAPRLHGGGRIDWAAGERPLIGKVGEEVGWPSQLAAKYGNGGGTVVNVSQVNNVTGSPDMSKEQFMAILAKNNKDLTKQINAALPDRVAAINRDPRRRG